MNLQFALVPVGIAVMAIPTTVLYGAKMRARLDRPVRRFDEGLGPLFRSWVNWVDLARGAAGAWLIQFALQDTISSADELATTFLAIELGIVFICVLAQTIWFHRPIRIIGPFFYLAGVSLVLSGPLTGSFALVTGLSCALMLGRLSSVFWFVSAGLAGFGFVFRKFDLVTAFDAFLFVIPAMLAFRYATRISFMRRPAVDRQQIQVKKKARVEKAKAAALKKAEPVRSVPAKPEAHRPHLAKEESPRAPVKIEAPRTLAKPEPVRAEIPRAELSLEMGTVIQTDFGAKPAKTAVLAPLQPAANPSPPPARRVAGTRSPIPDFLRIADDPKPVRKKIRIRVGRH